MGKAVSGNICTQTLKVAAQRSQVPSEKDTSFFFPESLILEVLGIIHTHGAKSLRERRDLEPTLHEVIF